MSDVYLISSIAGFLVVLSIVIITTVIECYLKSYLNNFYKNFINYRKPRKIVIKKKRR